MSELEITILKNRIEYKFGDITVYSSIYEVDYDELEHFLRSDTQLLFYGIKYYYVLFEFSNNSFKCSDGDRIRFEIELTDHERQQYKEEFRKKLRRLVIVKS